MKEIKTLEDALALVPEYFPLVQGVDKWKEGDKRICDGDMTEILKDTWFVNSIVGEIGLRPIPQSVQEAEAYRYLMDSDLHPKYATPIINAISTEGLKLAREYKHPFLAWVEENRK